MSLFVTKATQQTNSTASTTNYATKPVAPDYTIDFTGQGVNDNKDLKLTPEGSIPMVQNTGAESVKGLSLEKTSTKEPDEAKQQIPEEKPQKDFKKTGEAIDERLSRYYPKAYKNATTEEKEALLEKYITQHYSTLKDKPRAEQIKIQLTDFKKLLHNTQKGDDYEMLASKIDVLEKENQVLAAKNATVEQKSEYLRYRGEIGVARTIHKADKENQVELTQLVADSKNTQAIKIGASHSAELDKSNQVPAVKIYEATNLAPEQQKEVDKIIVNQYDDFAKENQVEIHKVISASKYTETVEYAASNIYKFDKSNQVAALNVTLATNNEKAITAASAQYAKYDKSVQSEIKTIINNTNYDSAKTTLEKAEVESNNQQTNTENKAETEQKETTTSNTEKSKSSSVEEIKTAVKENNNVKIEEHINNLTSSEKVSLIKQCPNNPDIIRIMLANNPSLEVLAQISKMYSQDNSVIDKKELMPQMTFLSADVQSSMLKDMAFNKNVHSINRAELKTTAKKEYDKLILKEQDKKWLV